MFLFTPPSQAESFPVLFFPFLSTFPWVFCFLKSLFHFLAYMLQLGSVLTLTYLCVSFAPVYFIVIEFQKYAMQQAFKTMMSQMNSQNSPMSNPSLSGSPFPIPPTFGTGTTVSPSVSESAASIDVTATKVEDEPVTNAKIGTENKEAKKFGN